MNHTFVILTVLAYLLSMGLYVQFLYTGKELTGRLATLLMFLGLGTHLPGPADERPRQPYGPLS